MYFLLAGIAALLMKYLEVGPVAAWPWWVALSPFGMAVAWWAWADSSGYTKRKEMDKMDKRKQDRLDKQREQMGTLSPKRKKINQ
jgi:small Trp-rich protein